MDELIPATHSSTKKPSLNPFDKPSSNPFEKKSSLNPFEDDDDDGVGESPEKTRSDSVLVTTKNVTQPDKNRHPDVSPDRNDRVTTAVTPNKGERTMKSADVNGHENTVLSANTRYAVLFSDVASGQLTCLFRNNRSLISLLAC